MYANDDSQMLEISSVKLYYIGLFHPWVRFVVCTHRRFVLREDSCLSGHFDGGHCLYQYVNIEELKGLSHEIAFEDMHGHF
jgi:hypothetical protein